MRARVGLMGVAFGVALSAQGAVAAETAKCRPGDLVCEGAAGGLATPPPAGNASGGEAHAVDGFIWLGNLRPDNTVASPTATLANGSPVATLDQLAPRTEVAIINAVFMRENQPKNDEQYFRGQKIVGVLEIGQKAVLQDAPIAIVRPSGLTQLWGRVRPSG